MPKVRFGIHLPNGGFDNLPFSHINKLATEAEKLGYDSLWVADHAIYPETLGPQNIFEPLTTLAALSTVTERVRLGTSILLPLRHPLLLANALSTLDSASNGRLILGIGVGWYKPEFDASAVPFNRRGEVQEEEIQLLKLLWGEPSVDFEGKHFLMKNVITGPKPVQKPYPKIWLGGGTEKTFQRIVKQGDGWLAWCPSVETFSAGVRRVKSIAESAGKDTSRMDFAADFMACVRKRDASAQVIAGRLNRSKENWIVGSPVSCTEAIGKYVKQGANHIILGFVPYKKELDSMKMTAEIMNSV
jgi:probable F420-dependent oxidoreductase